MKLTLFKHNNKREGKTEREFKAFIHVHFFHIDFLFNGMYCNIEKKRSNLYILLPQVNKKIL